MPERSSRKREPIHCYSVGEALMESYSIAILCKLCRYRRVVPGQPLYALCKARNWEDGFISLSNRMRCTRCGGKLATIVAVDEAADEGLAVGVQGEAAYKALVRRMRD
jgi:DNA-directed RNA polymerase subunit RPC12/RpoP